MKYKACNGTGKIMATIYENDEIGFVDKTYDCYCCNGTGKIKITNEEWFCQLPTEEKAKFLFEHGVICCQFCKGDCIEIDYKTSECKYNVSPSYSYTGIVEWLKQPHTVKE